MNRVFDAGRDALPFQESNRLKILAFANRVVETSAEKAEEHFFSIPLGAAPHSAGGFFAPRALLSLELMMGLRRLLAPSRAEGLVQNQREEYRPDVRHCNDLPNDGV